MKARFCCASVLTAACALVGADLPPLVLPQGVGVNIHFTRGHDKDLDMIAAAGFKFIRMDFSWGGTERKKGEYNWSDYDELTANLEKRGLRALYILDYSNGLYEETVVSKNPISGKEQRDTASPQHPESVAAFARWSAAAAEHFKGRRVVWEIWNEPNISFWKPKPDAKQYATLALATCQAIRAVDPQATIVAPASSGFPWTFMEEIFRAGALEHLDAVSVHPYRGYTLGPETAAADYRKLRGLIQRYAPAAKKDLPILSGEWGYASHAKGGVSLETQAAFVARQQLANLLFGVPLSIWYDWKNDGTDPNYNEHNFGTVTHDLQPKPAYLAVQTLTRELAGYRIARRLPTDDTAAFVLLCVNPAGDQKLAAWTTDKPQTLSLDLGLASADDVAAVNETGQMQPVKVQAGKLVLDLRAAPQYLTLKKRLRSLTAAAAWQAPGEQGLLVEAGKADGLQLPVRLQNPFSFPIEALVNLNGPSSLRQNAALALGPSETREHRFVGRISERNPELPVATLSVAYKEAATGQLIGRWHEERHLLLANPLHLTLAPADHGLRLHFYNPTRARFNGTASVAGRQYPISTDAERFDVRTVAPVHTPSPESVASVRVLDEHGQVAAETPWPRSSSLTVDRFRAALDGDPKVPAQASAAETDAPDASTRPFARAWKLDYQFDSGWRFVRCVPATSQAIFLQGKPSALGLWIHGDRSGNVLRARVTDDTGQTFQLNGPEIDWQGWRWVTFDLTDMKHAGHWGGANDGAVHGTLRLDCPLLVDGSSQKTSGTLYFAGLTLLLR